MDTSMIVFMLIFLFSLVNSQLLSQVPDVEEMARTPFILTTGELYRDMLTVETSKLAALFAKKYQPQVKQLARKHQMRSKLEKLRQPLPNFIERRVFDKGIRKDDDEIFDFTDSRFVNPPSINRQNFPLIEEEVPPNEISLVSASPSIGYAVEEEPKSSYQNKPATRYALPPTTPHASFTRFTYSPSTQPRPAHWSTPPPSVNSFPLSPYPSSPQPSYYSTPKPYFHSLPSYQSTPQPSCHTTLQPSYYSTYQPSYHSTPQPSYHPTHQPSYHSTPQPSFYPTPKPSYHSTPQPSYHSTPQLLFYPTPKPSYHPTPKPSYHSTPQPSFYPTPKPSYHSTPQSNYHSISSSYSTPKPFVNLGSSPYSGGYSYRPPTSFLSDATKSPRSPKQLKHYPYSPTPLPSYSQIHKSSPDPSYQQFSIGKSGHNLQSSYKSYTDHHLSNKGNPQKHPRSQNEYRDYKSDYSTNYVKPLKPFIHPSAKQPPSANPTYLSYHLPPSQYSSASAHILQPSLSLFPQTGYGGLGDNGLIHTL